MNAFEVFITSADIALRSHKSRLVLSVALGYRSERWLSRFFGPQTIRWGSSLEGLSMTSPRVLWLKGLH